MTIKGKVALVTGASSGIGAATALKLASLEAKVGLAARRRDRLAEVRDQIRAAGGEAIDIEMDVTDTVSVAAGVERLAAAFGSIDIVVNNAGLMPASDMESLKTAEWARMIDVNIKGVLNVTAATLPGMIVRSSGHFVNLSSIAGRKVFQGLAVYCATKHAIAALSDGMRMELAPKHNIRVTSIQPGAVATELFEHVSDANYRAQMEGLKEQMAFLTAGDIADTIAYAVTAPANVDIAELFVMPRQQAW